MNTYVISLERVKSRNNYIKKHVRERNLRHHIINAVDGALLSVEDLLTNCNMEKVNKYRQWLSNGAIACTLSHLKAYDEFLKTKDNCAFIIEDDVILPEGINSILMEIENEIRPNEIILLYYVSFQPSKFSSVGRVKLKQGGLYYPMNIEQTISSAAYVIGKDAAKEMSKMIKPIEVGTDSWHHFYSKGAFNSFRVHYPSQISIMNFKSSLEYLERGTAKQILTQLIEDYKIPVAYQWIKFVRKRKREKMLNHFTITMENSPIFNNLIQENESVREMSIKVV